MWVDHYHRRNLELRKQLKTIRVRARGSDDAALVHLTEANEAKKALAEAKKALEEAEKEKERAEELAKAREEEAARVRAEEAKKASARVKSARVKALAEGEALGFTKGKEVGIQEGAVLGVADFQASAQRRKECAREHYFAFRTAVQASRIALSRAGVDPGPLDSLLPALAGAPLEPESSTVLAREFAVFWIKAESRAGPIGVADPEPEEEEEAGDETTAPSVSARAHGGGTSGENPSGENPSTEKQPSPLRSVALIDLEE